MDKTGPLPTSVGQFSAVAKFCYSDSMSKYFDDYIIRPNPHDPRLTERVTGVDQTGERIETSVTVERALTIFLNGQEIVTAMTIGDYPEYLAIGYLLNQHMLLPDDWSPGSTTTRNFRSWWCARSERPIMRRS